MTTILKTSTFKPENVQFSPLKKNKRGGGAVYMNYLNKKTSETHAIYIQTPKMYCPFGASAYKKEDSNEVPKYSLQLSFKEDDGMVQELKGKFQGLDAFIVKEVLKNKEWQSTLGLGRSKLTADMVSMLHSTIVKEPKKPEYPSTVNVKLPVKFGTEEFQTNVYGKDKQKVELSYENIEQVIPARCEVRALLQVSAVWLIGNKLGVTIRASQLVVYPSDTLSGYSFMDSDDDEDETEAKNDESSDSEQSEAEEEVPEPVVEVSEPVAEEVSDPIVEKKKAKKVRKPKVKKVVK